MAQRVLVTDESYDNAIASILDYVSSEEEEEEGKSDEGLKIFRNRSFATVNSPLFKNWRIAVIFCVKGLALIDTPPRA